MTCTRCALCGGGDGAAGGAEGEGGAGAAALGPLLGPYGADLILVHKACAIWSPEVYEDDNGELKNIEKAVRRGRHLYCSYCGEKGATVGCRVEKCKCSYHVLCAYEADCQLANWLVSCPDHADAAHQAAVKERRRQERERKKLDRKRKRGSAAAADAAAARARAAAAAAAAALGGQAVPPLGGERRHDVVNLALADEDAEAREIAQGAPEGLRDVWALREERDFFIKQNARRARDMKRIQPLKITPEAAREGGFKTFGGMADHVRALREVVLLPLLYPDAFAQLGVTPPRGVLLHGAPGCGKTHAARALAAECAAASGSEVAFYARKGADCLGKFHGDAERELRLLFEHASQHQPAVIFFDEFDGLAPARGGRGDSVHSSVVSTLLALMDGLKDRGRVVVLAATNCPDALDAALRRPGRFDRELLFSLPARADRAAILRVHTRRWPEAARPSAALLAALARATEGFSAAELAALCASAVVVAATRAFGPVSDQAVALGRACGPAEGESDAGGAEAGGDAGQPSPGAGGQAAIVARPPEAASSEAPAPVLVWAKASGFPWWPAVRLPLDSPRLPAGARAARKPGCALVEFIDRDRSWAWLPCAAVRPYAPGADEHEAMAAQASKSILLTEALEGAAKQQERLAARAKRVAEHAAAAAEERRRSEEASRAKERRTAMAKAVVLVGAVAEGAAPPKAAAAASARALSASAPRYTRAAALAAAALMADGALARTDGCWRALVCGDGDQGQRGVASAALAALRAVPCVMADAAARATGGGAGGLVSAAAEARRLAASSGMAVLFLPDVHTWATAPVGTPDGGADAVGGADGMRVDAPVPDLAGAPLSQEWQLLEQQLEGACVAVLATASVPLAEVPRSLSAAFGGGGDAAGANGASNGAAASGARSRRALVGLGALEPADAARCVDAAASDVAAALSAAGVADEAAGGWRAKLAAVGTSSPSSAGALDDAIGAALHGTLGPLRASLGLRAPPS
eukprot:PRCOL_00001427-RA